MLQCCDKCFEEESSRSTAPISVLEDTQDNAVVYSPIPGPRAPPRHPMVNPLLPPPGFAKAGQSDRVGFEEAELQVQLAASVSAPATASSTPSITVAEVRAPSHPPAVAASRVAANSPPSSPSSSSSSSSTAPGKLQPETFAQPDIGQGSVLNPKRPMERKDKLVQSDRKRATKLPVSSELLSRSKKPRSRSPPRDLRDSFRSRASLLDQISDSANEISRAQVLVRNRVDEGKHQTQSATTGAFASGLTFRYASPARSGPAPGYNIGRRPTLGDRAGGGFAWAAADEYDGVGQSPRVLNTEWQPPARRRGRRQPRIGRPLPFGRGRTGVRFDIRPKTPPSSSEESDTSDSLSEEAEERGQGGAGGAVFKWVPYD
jgi:hypothetical protein